MKAVLFFIAVTLAGTSWGFEKEYLLDSVQTGLVKLVPYKGSNYLVTQHKLYKIGKKGLEVKAAFTFACADACVYKDGFAFATDSGLVTYALPHGDLKKLLPDQVRKPVNHVVVDAQQRLWFSVRYEGAYAVDNDTARLRVQAPVLYALAATTDSNVWAGTNLGLYKVPPTGSETMRYAEEGIEGFELPDNIVEHLLATTGSAVWALMPDNIAFISATNKEAAIASYRYPGGSDNQIFDIVNLPFAANAFLFATAQGLMYSNDLKSRVTVHAGEIHQTYHESAYAVPDALLEKPAVLMNEPVIAINHQKAQTWFVTRKGVWRLGNRNLMKRLRTAW